MNERSSEKCAAGAQCPSDTSNALVFVAYCLFPYRNGRGSVALMKSLAPLRSLVESALILGTFALAGCGSSEPSSTSNTPEPPPTTPPTTTTPPPTMPPPGDPTTMPPPMPPPTGEWKTLLTGDWTMQPGMEGYVCVRKTIEEDLVI